MEGMRNVEERVGNDTFHARDMPNWLDASIYEAQTPPRHRLTGASRLPISPRMKFQSLLELKMRKAGLWMETIESD